MPNPPGTEDRSMFSLVAVMISLLAFVVAAMGILVVNTKSTDDGRAATGAGSGSTTIEVTLTEFAIAPVTLSAPVGTVTLQVTNAGSQVHDLKIPSLGKATPHLAPGRSGTLELGQVAAGTYEVFCSIPGHIESGMKATLVVGGSTGQTGQSGQSGTSSADADNATIDFNASPGPDFTARDPKAPGPLPGTVHELTIEATEGVVEVAPGVKQQMWMFNLAGEAPAVPGPVLRGKVGDTFRITLVNKGAVDHSIDFHASKVAWNDEMRSIHSGESLVYEFTANHAGAFMYHCGTAPALHHIGNGMYGGIIIDPPDLPPVDHEYVLVQSELYTGPDGKPGDLDKMTSNAWDAVVFNGYVNQYKAKPIRVEPDERVRVWVIDDGPSENSAFHIVGTVFDTVWKEGSYLLRPGPGQGGAQVLDLQPAQGGFVEFTFDEAGLYPIVTHKFSNVGKGALGLFQAGEVTPPAGGGH